MPTTPTTTNRFITDGGLETTLVFHQGIDLPDFAAFPLLDTEEGRAALTSYFTPYFEVAERDRRGFVIDTATWRANPDWGTRLGYDRDSLADVNRRAVAFARDLGTTHGIDFSVNGVVGPRGDGYAIGSTMSAAEAASYHSLQVRSFAEAGADSVTAVTMTYAEEAIGIARAASEAGLASVISFTVETDGRLPSGQSLAAAIDQVDAATSSTPAWFMVNCAHPSHFDFVLGGGGTWTRRIGAVRANASRMSHEELDDSEELDRGNPAELANDYTKLAQLLPGLRVVGGCCGTDDAHIAAISRAI